jgi:phosphoribosylformylglycinamidine synthase
MIYRIYINYKKGILDPEAEALKKTIANMGIKSIVDLSKGKFFDIEIKSSETGLSEIKKISKDLLSNPVIENFKIIKK